MALPIIFIDENAQYKEIGGRIQDEAIQDAGCSAGRVWWAGKAMPALNGV